MDAGSFNIKGGFLLQVISMGERETKIILNFH